MVSVVTSQTLAPGVMVASKYRVVRKIGEGGMSTVWEAFHERLQQRVALKVLLFDFANDEEIVERFEREARAAATLDSPNITKVLDVDTLPDGVPYMVIEFLDGHDLASELEGRLRFPASEAVGLVMRACVPIAQAHAAGIIHRDLKPANLFLAKKGDAEVLKLLDFGISKVLEERDGKITHPDHALGSPQYMSPEQVRGLHDLDARTDVWSLGVILYELLTGTVPFPIESTAAIAAIVADPITPPREIWSDIPADLEAIVMRALEKDRDKRFQSIRELAMALARFAPDEIVPVSARFTPRHSIATIPPPSTEAAVKSVHPPPPPRRSSWLGLVLLAGVAAGGIGFWQLTIRERHVARPRTVVASTLPVVASSAAPHASESAPPVVVVESAAPSATTPQPTTHRHQRPQPSATTSAPPPSASATTSANPLML